ncbi:MAG: VOC family protein [Planctomycetia bacterium]|nr:VOC family protein [Planctomycetia bacterium]
MPTIHGVLETALHVADLDRAERFYADVLGFAVMVADGRLRALSVAGRQVLLLFQQGGTAQPVTLPGGVIPPHDGQGRLHLAFAIDAADWEPWRERLTAAGVAVESVVHWDRGGRSLYFRDPDQHLVELVTPGCWPIY